MDISAVKPSNFVEQILIEDIKNKGLKSVVTRVSCAPDDHLDLGQVKAMCVDFFSAEKFHGSTLVRINDNLPSKAKDDNVKEILEDMKWLGFKWKNLSFVSDYYDFLFECAVDLIRQGKAYVDDLSEAEIKTHRGACIDAGKDSPHRNRSVERNLRLFKEMNEGKFKEGEKFLRAKIDMAHKNQNMRDPIIYKISHQKHRRQGNKWHVYPTDDFAEALCDAHEGVTHSLYPLGLENNTDFYDWLVNNCQFVPALKPRRIEIPMLNIEEMVLSNKFYFELISEGYINSWNDPRILTISALRNKGYTPSAIRNFCIKLGVSKSNSVVKPQLLEACVREELVNEATSVVAVLDPIKVKITNFDAGKTEKVMIPNSPNEKSKTHPINFTNEIFIERKDFSLLPSKKFNGLVLDGEVRLKNSHIIHCDEVIKNDKGEVESLNCSIVFDAEKKGVVTKGEIHWLSQNYAEKITAKKYGNILKEGELYEVGTLDKIVDKESEKVFDAFIEPFALKQKSPLYFIRNGYFVEDKSASTKTNRVFVQIVS